MSSALLLDTTVLIDALRNRNQRRRFLAGLLAAGHSLVTSTINVAEVYGGLRPGEETATGSFLSGLHVIPVSVAIAVRAGSLQAEFRRKGQTRALIDMLVAATALEHGLQLLTDNTRDFKVPGLNLFPLP
ncbi:MAG TPA: type II toxin-antitoxin system VapC family toxin [Terracidiphilus sp.]|nr:type II toxin-antitoxin system VapC family toxin [Terracidiphilus sp.]